MRIQLTDFNERKMRKATNFFDDILKIFAVSSVLLIIIGFLNLRIYFGRFGININNYTSTSEIILSSVDKLLFVLFIMFFQISIWLYFFDYLFAYSLKKTVKDGEQIALKKYDETISRFVTNKSLMIFFVVLGCGSIISIILRSIFPSFYFFKILEEFFTTNFWMAGCFYFFFLQATRKLWEILKKNEDYNAKVITTFIIFLAVIITTIWWTNYLQFNKVRKYGNNERLEIILNDSLSIKPTDTIRYVGRTENYVFFWNKITHQTDIYPAGEIKKIIVKE